MCDSSMKTAETLSDSGKTVEISTLSLPVRTIHDDQDEKRFTVPSIAGLGSAALLRCALLLLCQNA